MRPSKRSKAQTVETLNPRSHVDAAVTDDKQNIGMHACYKDKKNPSPAKGVELKIGAISTRDCDSQQENLNKVTGGGDEPPLTASHRIASDTDMNLQTDKSDDHISCGSAESKTPSVSESISHLNLLPSSSLRSLSVGSFAHDEEKVEDQSTKSILTLRFVVNDDEQFKQVSSETQSESDSDRTVEIAIRYRVIDESEHLVVNKPEETKLERTGEIGKTELFILDEANVTDSTACQTAEIPQEASGTTVTSCEAPDVAKEGNTIDLASCQTADTEVIKEGPETANNTRDVCERVDSASKNGDPLVPTPEEVSVEEATAEKCADKSVSPASSHGKRPRRSRSLTLANRKHCHTTRRSASASPEQDSSRSSSSYVTARDRSLEYVRDEEFFDKTNQNTEWIKKLALSKPIEDFKRPLTKRAPPLKKGPMQATLSGQQMCSLVALQQEMEPKAIKSRYNYRPKKS
ncbi:uncharacterized protein [Watersipora subatra]|uniref:uncharacterized protein isoform X2 n=1 Tax=Watersipora subatra TaxID=2589382 RepID=UPI00355AD4AA